MSPGAVFIIGVGRSGTNLLSQVLDGNPAINFPLEQKFVMKSYRWLYDVPLTARAKEKFKALLREDIFLNNVWKINLDAVCKRIDELPENTSYPQLCNTVLDFRESLYSEKKNVKVYGYHNPRSTMHSENLAKAFPGCKFIFLHRHPLDNVSSYKKSKFFKGLVSIPFFAYRWKWYNDYCLYLEKKFPGRVFRLAYEDFVSYPRQKTMELCSFLEVEYSDHMLAFNEKFAPFYKENMIKDMYHVHIKMTDKINTKNIGAYKNTLTQQEIDFTSCVVNVTAKELGYEVPSCNNGLRARLGIFIALRYMFKFDFYALAQGILNRIVPGKIIKGLNRA